MKDVGKCVVEVVKPGRRCDLTVPVPEIALKVMLKLVVVELLVLSGPAFTM